MPWKEYSVTGASTLCRPSSRRRRHERGVPRFRHFPQDRRQDLQPLQGSGARLDALCDRSRWPVRYANQLPDQVEPADRRSPSELMVSLHAGEPPSTLFPPRNGAGASADVPAPPQKWALLVQSAFSQRAAASALSSGRVLNAIPASGAALCTALITASNIDRLWGGRRMPAPITTQS